MSEEKKQKKGPKKKPKLTKQFIWRLPIVMAERRIFTKTELHRLLSEIDIEISTAHLGRIYKDMPELLNIELLLGLMQVLDCSLNDLMQVEAATPPEDDGTGSDDDEVVEAGKKDAPQPESGKGKAIFPSAAPRKPQGKAPVAPRDEQGKVMDNVFALKDYDTQRPPGFHSKRNLRTEELDKE
jgi:DNA-binding Xre family transcriptional regulator